MIHLSLRALENSMLKDDLEPDPILPLPTTRRWTVRRKSAVVQAVRLGLLSLDEACGRYHLSLDEFMAWERALERYGVPGLRATRFQIYRDIDKR
jgi:hypothetical protein